VAGDGPPAAYFCNFIKNVIYCWICAQSGLWVGEQQQFGSAFTLRQHLQDTHLLMVVDPPTDLVVSPLVARIESVLRRTRAFFCHSDIAVGVNPAVAPHVADMIYRISRHRSKPRHVRGTTGATCTGVAGMCRSVDRSNRAGFAGDAARERACRILVLSGGVVLFPAASTRTRPTRTALPAVRAGSVLMDARTVPIL
jgi:hypothetical protein